MFYTVSEFEEVECLLTNKVSELVGYEWSIQDLYSFVRHECLIQVLKSWDMNV